MASFSSQVVASVVSLNNLTEPIMASEDSLNHLTNQTVMASSEESVNNPTDQTMLRRCSEKLEWFHLVPPSWFTQTVASEDFLNHLTNQTVVASVVSLNNLTEPNVIASEDSLNSPSDTIVVKEEVLDETENVQVIASEDSLNSPSDTIVVASVFSLNNLTEPNVIASEDTSNSHSDTIVVKEEVLDETENVQVIASEDSLNSPSDTIVVASVFSLNNLTEPNVIASEDTSNSHSDTIVVKEEVLDETENVEIYTLEYSELQFSNAGSHILEMKEEVISDYSADEFEAIEDFECFEVMMSEGTLPYKLNIEPCSENLSDEELPCSEDLSDREKFTLEEDYPAGGIIETVNCEQLSLYVSHFGNFSNSHFPIKVKKEELETEQGNNEIVYTTNMSPESRTAPIEQRRSNSKSNSKKRLNSVTTAKKQNKRRRSDRRKSVLSEDNPVSVHEFLEGDLTTIINMGWDCYFTNVPNQVVRNLSNFQILNGFLMSLEELSLYGICGKKLDFYTKIRHQRLSQKSEPLQDHLEELEDLDSSENQQDTSERTINCHLHAEIFHSKTTKLLLKVHKQITGNRHRCVTFTSAYKKVTESFQERLDYSLKFIELKVDHHSFKDIIKNDRLLNYYHLHIWDEEEYGQKRLSEMFHSPRPFHGFINIKAHILSKVIKPDPEPEPLPIDFKFWTCQVCRFESSAHEIFLSHFIKKSAVYTYLCSRCGFLKFRNICSLLYHILLHTDEKMVEFCLACGKQFPSLTCHLTEPQAESEMLKCTQCNFTSKNKCTLDYHSECHKNFFFVCNQCKDVFYNPNQLEHHQSVCIENSTSLLVFCPACKIYFSEASHFELHIQFDHYLRVNYCSYCKIGFRSLDRIKRHVNEVHPHGSHKILNLCTICPLNTFRGQRQWDHFSYHAREERLIKKAYYCRCKFITLEKEKFIRHLNFDGTCFEPDTKPQRSLFLKKCSMCNSLKSYNFTEPFCCEKCQIDVVKKKYMCTRCNFIIDYDFDVFLDHFFIKHPIRKEPPVKESSFRIVELSDKQLMHSKKNKNANLSQPELIINSRNPINREALNKKYINILPKSINQKIHIQKKNFYLMNHLKQKTLETETPLDSRNPVNDETCTKKIKLSHTGLMEPTNQKSFQSALSQFRKILPKSGHFQPEHQ